MTFKLNALASENFVMPLKTKILGTHCLGNYDNYRTKMGALVGFQARSVAMSLTTGCTMILIRLSTKLRGDPNGKRMCKRYLQWICGEENLRVATRRAAAPQLVGPWAPENRALLEASH
jgi:hypothetical protein